MRIFQPAERARLDCFFPRFEEVSIHVFFPPRFPQSLRLIENGKIEKEKRTNGHVQTGLSMDTPRAI